MSTKFLFGKSQFFPLKKKMEAGKGVDSTNELLNNENQEFIKLFVDKTTQTYSYDVESKFLPIEELEKAKTADILSYVSRLQYLVEQQAEEIRIYQAKAIASRRLYEINKKHKEELRQLKAEEKLKKCEKQQALFQLPLMQLPLMQLPLMQQPLVQQPLMQQPHHHQQKKKRGLKVKFKEPEEEQSSGVVSESDEPVAGSSTKISIATQTIAKIQIIGEPELMFVDGYTKPEKPMDLEQIIDLTNVSEETIDDTSDVSSETSVTALPKSPTTITNTDSVVASNLHTDHMKNSQNEIDTFNFVEEIKQAAENAQNSTGFIYEPTSGLYYDSNTGYYYNAESGLYYDGNTGVYYQYIQERNQFEYHSQLMTNDNQTGPSLMDQYCKQFLNNKIDPKDDTPSTSTSVVPSSAITTGTTITTATTSCTHTEQLNTLKCNKYQRNRFKRSRKGYDKSTDNYKDLKKKKLSNRMEDDDHTDKEDGELSGSLSNSDSNDSDSVKIDEHNNDDIDENDNVDNSLNKFIKYSNNRMDSIECKKYKYEDIATSYPPSLRIIVWDTNLPKLKIGELFIITCMGGTLGREGSHEVLIPDINVSKYHLAFSYNNEKSVYQCTDLGSRNGTILNGKRMSASKQQSKPFDVLHGTILEFSQTILMCHIHDGHTTCDQCEPGVFIAQKNLRSKSTSIVASTSAVISSAPISSASVVAAAAAATTATTNTTSTIAQSHKKQLKTLKKRYGLEDDKYTLSPSIIKAATDRAAERRKLVGSFDGHEKTAVASTETSISNDNKGFKMLTKLGWSEGQTLGVNNTGLLEPIPLLTNIERKGLGTSDGTNDVTIIKLDKKSVKKNAQLKKTQERYNNIKLFPDKDKN